MPRKKQDWNEGKSSRSAIAAAMLRHMAARESNAACAGPDIYAKYFLPPNIRAVLGLRFYRKLMKRNFVGGYAYLYARTAHYDALFREAASEGIEQILLLGAGYDTRAIRYSDQLGEIRVFELDSPEVLNRKAQIISEEEIPQPENVRPVPINFDEDDLERTLKEAGYSTYAKSLFIWEGVSMYLEEGSIRQTLGFVCNNAASGSLLGFDYVYAGALIGDESLFGAKETADAVAEGREPFTFGLDPVEMAAFTATYGLEVITHLETDEFARRYLPASCEDIYGKSYGFMGNIVVRVP